MLGVQRMVFISCMAVSCILPDNGIELRKVM